MPQTRVSTQEERPRLYRLEPSAHKGLTPTLVPHTVANPPVDLKLPEPPFPRFPEKCGNVAY